MEKKKLTFQLDTPYSAVSWPQISTEDQDTILELLCSLLSPIGQYRAQHSKPSKGKRDRKRKRKEEVRAESQPVPSPPKPELASFVDVGLSTVTRSFQSLARIQSDTTDTKTWKPDQPRESAEYSAIFVARSGQPSILYNHLPQMVAVASEASPTNEAIRLVGLSKACQDRLSDTLGIPRVSCIGVREGAPNSKALVDFICQHVPTIDVPWLRESQSSEYKETKIKTMQTVVGPKKTNRTPTK